jgi:hypothetical protein
MLGGCRSFHVDPFRISRRSGENENKKVVLTKMKLVSDLALLALFIRTAFFDASSEFFRPFFILLSDMKIISIAAHLILLSRWKATLEEDKPPVTGVSMAALFESLYGALFAVLLYFFPDIFAPGAFLAYCITTPLGNNEFDALDIWAARFEGAYMFSFSSLLWESGKTPRSRPLHFCISARGGRHNRRL